jgi:BirA family biotin operon repressor/biotin-[acetyl-CoA-carboxylase] ligase
MPEDLHPRPLRTPIVELAEVDSTNSEAMRRAAAGERGPLWLTAARQTAGRGRSGRAWASVDGNLMATLLIEPGSPAARLGELSLVAGVAAHDAIASIRPAGNVSPRLRLKWPNDILLGDAKVGGILVESTSYVGAIVSAIGFGINIVEAPAIPGRASTALAAHGAPPTPAALLAALSERMADWLSIWREATGFERVRTAWLERAGPEGETMSVNTGSTVLSGSFAGLDLDGALLLRDAAGSLRRFAFGDVTHTPAPTVAQRGCHER